MALSTEPRNFSGTVSSVSYAVPPVRARTSARFGAVFLLTLIACAALLPIVCFGWVNYYRDPGAGWCEILYQQKQIIADRRAQFPRRILIVGGSSALFGIDAELIEKKLKIPTVNLGTHAGLGLRYLLERARRIARPGDIVLLSPEYETWNDSYRDSPGVFLDYVWTYDKRSLLHLPPTELATMVWNIPLSAYAESLTGWLERFKGRQFHFENTANYSPATLSENGDIRVNHLPRPEILPMVSEPLAGNFSTQALQGLGEFCASAKGNNIEVMLSWPQMARPAGAAHLEVPQPLMNSIVADGIKVLDAPAENAYAPEWFMDTAYHCDPCCRRLRTEALIDHLRIALEIALPVAESNKVFLLSGGTHRVMPGNLFADQTGAQFRYLCSSPVDDSRAITVPEVAELVAKGKDVETDSPDALALLASAQLDLQPVAVEFSDLTDWESHYSDALFLEWGPVEGNFCRVDVSGAGRFAQPPQMSSISSGAPFERTISSLTPFHSAVPCEINITVDAKKYVSLSVDGHDFLQSQGGPAAVAIDPELGTVMDAETFGKSSTKSGWHLYRVVAASHSQVKN